MAGDWIEDFLSLSDEIDADRQSNQGTLSREIESSARRWLSGLLHVGGAAGIKSAQDEAERQSTIADIRASGSSLPQSWEDVEGITDIPGYVAHLGIQSAPYIAEFATGAGAIGRRLATAGMSQGAARTAGGVAASYPSSVGQIAGAQQEQAGEYNAPAAAALGVPFAALSAFGGAEQIIARGLPRSAIQNRAGRAAVGAGGSALSEGASEVGQQFIEEIGRSTVDGSHDLLGSEARARYKEAAIGGAVLGGTIGGAAGAVSSRRNDHSPGPVAPPQELLALPAPPIYAGQGDWSSPEPPGQPPMLALPAPPAIDQMSPLMLEGPKYYADAAGNVSRSPDLDAEGQRLSTEQGQGELFRQSETFSQAPGTPAPEQSETAPEADTQGDMLRGTRVEAEAEVNSEIARAESTLASEYNASGIARQLREANNGKVDSFVAKLAANLSRALQKGPDAAVELINDEQARPISAKRGRILERAIAIVDGFEARRGELDANKAAAAQLVEQSRVQDATERARTATRPGAEVRMPDAGSESEMQIRERNQEQALDEGLQDADRLVADSQKQRTAARRKQILDKVLEDPDTKNPSGRFVVALRREGIRDTKLTHAERETILSFQRVEQAVARENRQPRPTAEPQAAETATPASRSRYAAENFELTSPPSTPEDFERLERAQAKRARKRGDTQQESPPTRDRRQLEMFTPKTGQPTKAADQLQREERAPPAPEPETPAPKQGNIETSRYANLVDRAVDRGSIGLEEAMDLYRLLDSGTPDEIAQVQSAIRAAGRTERGDSAAPKAAPEKPAEQTAEPEAPARPKRPKRSDTDGAVKNPTSTNTMRKTLLDLFQSPARFDNLVRIYKSVDEAVADGSLTEEEVLGHTPRGLVKEINGRPRVFLFADNIETGAELSVFLHEIAGHIGLKKMLGVRLYNDLVKQVERWAQRGDNSPEAVAAEWAMGRVKDMAGKIRNEELVAYAIEGLVNQGVNPQAAGNTEAGNWFRRLWASVKSALRKLGFKNPDALSGQNMVDLAFGAANLELSAAWHGTMGDFRLFNHTFMGSGEGNQTFGWGTYLAEVRKVADGYREADSVRKTKRGKFGNLLRVAPTVRESEFLLLDEPVTNQSPEVFKVLQENLLGGPDKLVGMTGLDAYGELTQEMGSDKAASEFLDSLGVKGIKFKDQLSRNDPSREPTFNYVIFNAKNLVRVTSNPGGDPTKVKFSEVGPGPAPAWVAKLKDKVRAWAMSRKAESDLDKYVAASNLEAFGASRFVASEGQSLTIDAAYNEYTDWAEGRSTTPMTKAAFGGWMNRQGYQAHHIAGAQRLIGVTWTPQAEFAHASRGQVNTDWTNNSRQQGGAFSQSERAAGKMSWSQPANDLDAYSGEVKRQLNKTTNPYQPLLERVRQGESVNLGLYRSLKKGEQELRGDDGPTIKFSEVGPGPQPQVRTTPDVIAKTAAKLHPSLEGPARSFATTALDLTKKGLYGVAFGRDLRDLIGKQLPAYRNYFQAMAEKQATMLNLASTIDEIMVDSSKLSVEDKAKLNTFLKNATLSQEWGYQPAWNDRRVEITPKARKEYNALTPEAKKLADRIFEHGYKTRNQLRDVVKAQIDAEFADVDRRGMTRDEIQKLENRKLRQMNVFDKTVSQLAGPYAPLMRFGNHATVAKSQEYLDAEKEGNGNLLETLRGDPEHYAVFFSDTAGQADAKMREMQQKGFPYAEAFERERFFKDMHETPWLAMQRLKTIIADELGEDQGGSKELRRINGMLRDLYLSTISEASARKHDLRRQGIEGASDDMLRSFAAKGKADAHFISALQNNSHVVDTLSAMRQQASEPGKRADRKRALNEVLTRHAQSLEMVNTPIQDKAMSVTSFWMLATNPRYYVQNLLQTPMISAPTMAGRYGLTSSWNELQSAYRQMVTGFGDVQGFISGRYDIRALESAGVTADEIKLLENLRDTGLLDVGLQYDLGYWESGGSKVGNVTAAVNHKVRTLARQVEITNRVTTALATYRLAKKEGKGHADAVTAADDIVSQTHGDYSYLNKPRLMRSLPKMITQFRTYQLIQLSLIARYGAQMFQGVSPEERAVARRTMGYVLGQHAIITGALGLPAVQAVAYVMAAMFGDDDEPADGERFLRKAIGDDTIANFLLKGVPAGAGLDVSKYIGMGEATSLMPMTDINLTSRDGYAETVVGAMGPTIGGVLPMMADGLGMIAKGDMYKGIETMMPTGIRGGMRALRQHNDGVTNRAGDQLLTPEEITIFDSAMQALGFETTKMQELRRRRGDLFEYEEYYKGRTSALRFQYTKAVRDGDTAKQAEIRQQWHTLQDAKDRTGFKRSPISNLLRAPADQKKRERQTDRGVQYTNSNRRFVESIE